ncbi:hypothetical protein N7492_000545 [Penicillium capsulatum]|uniref:Aminoglycoside phosphotransferase domain-containing protein n=1 Tax=Penicillium capsulatum TaxID=69766 RepID=A0A9W9IRZ5_9EURO|nr:hypothetical protein N7492_000545 [Penicillium capsulatum]KAJ6130397.1 hypothetical protein N7512_003177 [Penicillium capsulatum]
MALITDGQLFTSFPASAYIVFSYLKSQLQALAAKPTENPVEATEQFYLKHVDDKRDHLMVDEELNIIGIIDWQMARVVPAGEAFGPSLVTAEMGGIYNGRSSLIVHDLALAHFLKAKGAAGLADIMKTLPLIRGIWTAFGVDKDTEWKSWKVDMLGKHTHDERLKHILDTSEAGP